MTSSEEDPRSKRGGHRLFDHSFFPDTAIIRARGQNFTISTSYLALHSPFFNNLFYGPNPNPKNGRFELDIDPDVFGDLLDIIYPSYKETECCKGSSSLNNLLELALQLELRFAVKRLLKDKYPSDDVVRILHKHNAVTCYSTSLFGDQQVNVTNDMKVERDASPSLDPLPVTDDFPDSIAVNVRGMSMLVSATTLSLHSSLLSEKLYKKGQLMKGVKIDVNPHSFFTFLQAVSGEFPDDITCEFLDVLLLLGAKHMYEYCLSETRKKIMKRWEKRDVIQLLMHYSKSSTPDQGNMSSLVWNLSRDQLDDLLSDCSFLSPIVKKEMRDNIKEKLHRDKKEDVSSWVGTTRKRSLQRSFDDILSPNHSLHTDYEKGGVRSFIEEKPSVALHCMDYKKAEVPEWVGTTGKMGSGSYVGIYAPHHSIFEGDPTDVPEKRERKSIRRFGSS